MRYGLSESNRGNLADRSSFPAQSSVLDEVALLHRVVREYELPTPTDCMFLERGDSDVYQIHTVGPAFYLKIYRPPHPTERAEAEARLVAKLLQHGASVVAAVPRCHLSGYTDPGVFTNRGPVVFIETGPMVFTQRGPVVFTQDGPVVFTQDGPEIFTQTGPAVFTHSGPLGIAHTERRRR